MVCIQDTEWFVSEILNGLDQQVELFGKRTFHGLEPGN
jgi:hypothetical protein